MNEVTVFTPSLDNFMANRHTRLLLATLQFAISAAEWIESDTSGQMLALMDTQYPNCASAMEYFTQSLAREWYDSVSDLYLALGRYLDLRNRFDESRRWGNALIRASNLQLSPELAERTSSIVTQGGQPRILDETTLLAMPLEDINTLAELVNLRGYGLWQIGKRSDALAFYHYALRLFQMSGKTLGIAGVMLNISSVYDSESRLDLAVEWARKALAVAREADDILLTAEVAQHLASLLSEGGSMVEINQLYELSVTNFRSVNELAKAADAQFDYALYRFECGDIETALILARDTISFYEQLGEERIQLIRGWIKQVEAHHGDEKML